MFSRVVWPKGSSTHLVLAKSQLKNLSQCLSHPHPTPPLQTRCRASNLRLRDADNASENHQHMSMISKKARDLINSPK